MHRICLAVPTAVASRRPSSFPRPSSFAPAFLASAILVLATASSTSFAAAQESASRGEGSAALDPAWQAVYDRAVESEEATGGIAIRVARGDSVLFEAEVGFRTDETVPIASGTKWFSSATIMSLIDEGLLSLDSRVDEFFPEYEGTQKGSITLAHILSYTSGLQSPDCPDMTLAECAEHVLSLDVHATRGTEYRYGGLAWQVAGRMAELAAGGTPFPELFRERIAEPLGMDETTYIDASNPSLSGGARSNLEDYDRFLKMIMDYGVYRPAEGGPAVTVLSRDAVRTMELHWSGFYGAEIMGSPRSDTRYGLGVWQLGGRTPSGEPVRIASRGAFGTSPWIERPLDYRGLIFMEGSYAAGTELFDDLVPLIQEAVSGR